MDIYTTYLGYTIRVYTKQDPANAEGSKYYIRVTEPTGILLREGEVTTGTISSYLTTITNYIDSVESDRATFQAALDGV